MAALSATDAVSWWAEAPAGDDDGASDLQLTHVHGDTTPGLSNLHVPFGVGLTGLVQRIERPAWVDDYFAADEISHVFDTQIAAEGIRRLLAVPVITGRRLRGVLALGERAAGAFGDRAVGRATDIASDLSHRIALADRARLAREVAVLEERRRVAAELHDSVGALLFAIGSSAARLEELLDGQAEAADALARLQEQTSAASQALRSSLRALNGSPTAVALCVTVQSDCTAFTERTGLPASLVLLDDGPPVLPPSRTAIVVAAVREGLLNVEKHAGATVVAVTLAERSGGGIIAAVTDDGVGLTNSASEGLGLSKMREAVARIGGWVGLSSEPGDGTTLRIEVPC
ncbi:histidine kinase [Gordonia terrae]|uniref:histidine kinase n=1 Tax=Gordonia terrae TaxID=2055 RepID=UPI000AC9FB27